MHNNIKIRDFTNSAGRTQDIVLSYQKFGQDSQYAPTVLINHALTGNSLVTGENGWWKQIVGKEKSIDTEKFAVLAFNVPGNGFLEEEENLLHNYKEFQLRDIAKLFLLGLKELKIDQLFAIVGGSIGGALAWEMAALEPKLAQNIIPIATDCKTTDWVLAQCKVQDHILNNSRSPVCDARMHAMTFYRTPQSFSERFRREQDEKKQFQVQNWLSYHGHKLEKRYQLASYKLMNHLLSSIDISNGKGNYLEVAKSISANIHIVTINSDLFFLAEENWETFVELSLVKQNIHIHEIKSIHGHDAFLIETRQMAAILNSIFNPKQFHHEKDTSSAFWNG